MQLIWRWMCWPSRSKPSRSRPSCPGSGDSTAAGKGEHIQHQFLLKRRQTSHTGDHHYHYQTSHTGEDNNIDYNLVNLVLTMISMIFIISSNGDRPKTQSVSQYWWESSESGDTELCSSRSLWSWWYGVFFFSLVLPLKVLSTNKLI